MEWCYDYYGEDYYSHSEENNPMGPIEPSDPEYDFKVRRGSNQGPSAKGCTYYNRERDVIIFSIISDAVSTGFRVARPI
ncbi:hypothetical protein [Lentimicrobium sp. S6]|uniref:hypothetical protein n=1 Tax=Lentimicrobium sp. S6 TaxID=2735872 RepID=UPI00155350E7|nr:hypothetical protein [Lentimicrobium sp. S6]NPD47905.1 hypothetical protein [Lentimicrobium sp. S6]